MQGRKELETLLSKVLEERSKLSRKPPVLLKIAPDLTDADLHDVITVVKGLRIGKKNMMGMMTKENQQQ